MSASVLTILLATAHARLPNLSRAEPTWLFAVFAAHLLMVSTRGLALRALAPRLSRKKLLSWIHLAARHQLIFSVAPGGAGDAGFPYFAKRVAALDPQDSVRMIAQFRMRDLTFVALIGVAGLILLNISDRAALLVLAVALPVLWFSDDLTVHVFRVAMRIAPRNRISVFLQRAADQEAPVARERIIRNTLALLVWSFSTAAVMSAFRAIGVPICIAQALVFIAAVNFAGAISLSIAGLGTSEAGATVALILAGRSIRRASSLALVVRPLLLVSVVCTSAILDLAISAFNSRSRVPVSTP